MNSQVKNVVGGRFSDVQTQSARLLADSDEATHLGAEEADILRNAKGRIALFHMEWPLSFGSARDIARMLVASPEKDVLIVDLAHVPFIDSRASNSLEEAIAAVQRDNDMVLLCGLQPAVRQTLDKIGLLRSISADRIVDSRLDALRAAMRFLADNEPGR